MWIRGRTDTVGNFLGERIARSVLMFVRECGGHNRFLISSIAVISLSSVANNFFSVHLYAKIILVKFTIP
ncbi:MAG TPA: hypothetical protein DCL47_11040 [Pantoea agglomerans]|nr:hypothetical protein [Pantoea agglomerans]